MCNRASRLAVALGLLVCACSTSRREPSTSARSLTDAGVEPVSDADTPRAVRDSSTAPETNATAPGLDAMPPTAAPSSDAQAARDADAGLSHDTEPTAREAGPAEPTREYDAGQIQDLPLADCSAWSPAPFEGPPVLLSTNHVLAACGDELGNLDLTSGSFERLALISGQLATFGASATHIAFIDAQGLKSVAVTGGALTMLAAQAESPIQITDDGRFVVFLVAGMPGEARTYHAVAVDGSSEPWALPGSVHYGDYGQTSRETRLLYQDDAGLLRSYDLATRQSTSIQPSSARVLGVHTTEPRVVALFDSSNFKLWTVGFDGTINRAPVVLGYQSSGVGFTPDAAGLVLGRADGSRHFLSLKTGESIALAQQPSAQAQDFLVVDSAILYQVRHPYDGVNAAWYEVYALPLNGSPTVSFGRMQPFFDDAYWTGSITVSHDRTRMVFDNAEFGRTLVDLDSLTVRAVVHDVGYAPTNYWLPEGFSPDASHVYYSGCSSSKHGCFFSIVDSDGAHPVTVQYGADVGNVLFSPDSRYAIIRGRDNANGEDADIVIRIDDNHLFSLPPSTAMHFMWIDSRRLLIERNGLHVVSVP